MPKVFVSHSSRDRLFVEHEIVALLTRHKIETWYSRDDIRSASDWERSIRSALSACDWFLVALSPHAVESEWVRSELHWAMENRAEHIIPIIVATCNANNLHLGLARVQHIDFRNDLQNARQRLLKIWNIRYEYRRHPHELRLVQGPYESQGTIYPIDGRVIVGHEPDEALFPDCKAIKLNDLCLGRNHALFDLGNDGLVRVTDVGSPNGTFVNHEILRQQRVLQDGDEIRMGMSQFLYRCFPGSSDE